MPRNHNKSLEESKRAVAHALADKIFEMKVKQHMEQIPKRKPKTAVILTHLKELTYELERMHASYNTTTGTDLQLRTLTILPNLRSLVKQVTNTMELVDVVYLQMIADIKERADARAEARHQAAKAAQKGRT